MNWRFFIDVGGTFTDCLGIDPEGKLLRTKVLSSGVIKGVAAAGSSERVLVDPARRRDPARFWNGYRLSCGSHEIAFVESFDALTGELSLDRSLAGLAPGAAYELTADEEAPLLAIRYLMGHSRDEAIPTVSVRLGTTRGTNALLTRRGAHTALVTTRGFGDVLAIGNQNRPKLFELAIRKPAPLAETSIEIDERVAIDGEVLRPLDEAAVLSQLQALRATGVESLAICLLNAYCQSAHEQRLLALAKEAGFESIVASHEIAPAIKLVSRADTTVLDAYLNPILDGYVKRLQAALGPGADLRLMTSSGALAPAERFSGKDSILSGPAGGAVGFARAAEAAGFERAIGFDMGGTSTDVARFDGRHELEYETEKAGVRIVAPTLAIETVAAGGGSICAFDGVRLTVGPDSAGADPGPACYGAGGPLTVTDMNLYLGRLAPEHFPFPIQASAVETALAALCEKARQAGAADYSPQSLAEGFLRIANTKMAQAIRTISVAKGYDVRDYPLVAFGGAAAQHACAVAAELDMRQVLVHPQASLLSAWGIGLANISAHRSKGVHAPLDEWSPKELEAIFADLAASARDEALAEGAASDSLETRRLLELRYRGQDAAIAIAESAGVSWRDSFEAEHLRLYGYAHANRPLEIVAARVEVSGKDSVAVELGATALEETSLERVSSLSRQVVFDGQLRETPLIGWSDIEPSQPIAGPAIVVSEYTTVVVEPGWQVERLPKGELLLSFNTEPSATTAFSVFSSEGEDSMPTQDVTDRPCFDTVAHRHIERPPPPALPAAGEGAGRGTRWPRRFAGALSSQHDRVSEDAADPILLEVFNNHFASIAQQMGVTLRNTSSSVNVKERLDFSCALFTATGDLVVNAPHIPVHLGAMGETVRQLLADNPDLAPGDVLIANDPYAGGSHLPDVTVVTPVHDPRDASSELLFLTASRAHHAEIGGISPGSMPPFSQNLAEEGVVLRNFKLVSAGQSREAELRQLLTSGPYPSRSPDDNMADIAAQVAANRQGARDLLSLIERHGREQTLAYMRHIQAAAERKTRAALSRLPLGLRTFEDSLDDGSKIQVAIDIGAERTTIDFTGSAGVHPGNLNANRAICSAAVMYVLRLLIDEEIPLNQGVLAPIDLIVPPGLLNPPAGNSPETTPAVAGGNVETSQRIVDVLLGAFGLAAASQGTMNNLLFGDGSFGYYETICGGAGATPFASGASAVHTHMTNTRITDPEVFERRYPARIWRFAIRKGSGGAGAFQGGEGVVREIEFLRPLTLSIISQRRGDNRPYGLSGGEPGAAGINRLIRSSGAIEELPALARVEVVPGDRIIIESPGGGGIAPVKAH